MADPPKPRDRYPNAQGIATRQAIVVEAGRIFAERGYEGASMRDIAEGSGAALSSLVYHFKTKKNLYLAAIQHYVIAESKLDHHFRFFHDLNYDDHQAVVDAIRDSIRSFLEACHGPSANEITLALYRRIMVESDVEALMMLLECFVPVQQLLPQVIARIRPDFTEVDIGFWVQMYWSLLQYTVMGKKLILYDMQLGDEYPTAYLDEASWRFAQYCAAPLGLPEPTRYA